MSAYRVHESQIKMQDAILEALVDRIIQHKNISESEARKLVKDNVQIHKIPQKLRGYRNDEREQKAEIIAPKSFVNRYISRGASNDLGFYKEHGKYAAFVSLHDEGTWWNKAAPRFWQAAQTHEAIKAAKLQGYSVQKKEVNGVIQLVCLSHK
jgi:hypothetical protein